MPRRSLPSGGIEGQVEAAQVKNGGPIKVDGWVSDTYSYAEFEFTSRKEEDLNLS